VLFAIALAVGLGLGFAITRWWSVLIALLLGVLGVSGGIAIRSLEQGAPSTGSGLVFAAGLCLFVVAVGAGGSLLVRRFASRFARPY